MARAEERRQAYSVEDNAANTFRGYSTEEEKARTNVHYEQPVEFFNTITGGDWNVYSCNLWDDGATETESQERKLDLLARLMDLRPGQRVLDVGCGWGGPLVYLAKRYGVRGVGLTLSASQLAYAEARAREHGVDVEVRECHWRDFADDAGFDAVYTDEVIVHFNELGAYFDTVRGLLRPGGRMLNKELHFTNSKFMQPTRAMIFVNKIYGETGNYRPLHEELALLDGAGFVLERVEQIPMMHYRMTLESWLGNMQQSRARLEELVGAEYWRAFRTYLRIVLRVINGASMTLDVVVARRPD